MKPGQHPADLKRTNARPDIASQTPTARRVAEVLP